MIRKTIATNVARGLAVAVAALVSTSASAQLACADSFSPDKVAAGENCTPVYHRFCPTLVDDKAGYEEPVGECEGVRIERGTASGGGLTADYIILSPAAPTAPVETLYLGLHWKGANAEAQANAQRMQELVKARNVAVVLPTAPDNYWPASTVGVNLAKFVSPTNGGAIILPGLSLPQLPPNVALPLPELKTLNDRLNRSLSKLQLLPAGTPLIPAIELPPLPVDFRDYLGVLPILDPLLPIDPFVELLDAVVAGASATLGLEDPELLVSGLSNGGQMAWYYACRTERRIDAMMVVAGSVATPELEACVARPRNFGAVLVHGSGDYLVPYTGKTLAASLPQAFQAIRQDNGCPNNGLQMTVMPSLRSEILIRGVALRWYEGCTSGRGSYLVTIRNGGHNWPGFDYHNERTIRPLGLATKSFDATLQGYDLLRLAADTSR